MEEWTSVRDDDDGNGDRRFGFAFDLEFRLEECRFDSSRERLRSLFDQVLVDFLRDKSVSKCIRPIPALCGDGRPVDLFKLFWVVRKIGGYGVVSRNYLWGFVLEECGLDLCVIPSVKLIYMKYLDEFDQWLQRVSFEDRQNGVIEKLDLLSRELETRFRGLMEIDEDEKIICELDEDDGRYCINDDFAASAKRVVEKAMNEANGIFGRKKIDDDSGNEERDNVMASARKLIEKVINKVHNCEKTIASDNDGNGERRYVQDDNNVFISAKKVVEKAITKAHYISAENITNDEEIFSAQKGIDIMNRVDFRKRKRESESFEGMLKWLSYAAKHSDDPSTGLIPECSKWSEYGNDEFWVQAILVREALMIRKHANTNAGENLLKDQQKKPRMHPSLYREDALDHQSIEKLRCSKRISIPSPTKSHFCPCCNSSQNKNTIRQEAEIVNNSLKLPPKHVVTDVEEPHTNSKAHNNLSDMPVERQVCVGPLFQAQVPEWTGVPSESDPKWLGTRMWPPEDCEQNSTVRSDPTGKGRQQPCNCPFRDSVECVRFHIAEKRLKLKRELGSLFYKWRFDRMGEEVSLSWTKEEEKKFKDMMSSYAALSNKFRNNAAKYLPSKTRTKLVSYYFDVFVVQRRSYQNRVTPKDVDSDDDEKECGSIGDSFGYKALCIPNSRLISCTLNKESNEVV